MSAHDMDHPPGPELPPAIKQALPRYKAPPGLERRVRHQLHAQPRRAEWFARARASWARWLPTAAGFAFGVIFTVGIVAVRDVPPGTGDMGEEVVASHLRSLQASHLTDVASTDRHTVKPWFTGKLDYAPPVIDLAQQGFALTGGRLDYVQGRPVAAMVYRHGAHTINLFALPQTTGSRADAIEVRHGFQVASWSQGGMRLWAVSDIGREEMAQFVAAMKTAVSPGG